MPKGIPFRFVCVGLKVASRLSALQLLMGLSMSSVVIVVNSKHKIRETLVGTKKNMKLAKKLKKW